MGNHPSQSSVRSQSVADRHRTRTAEAITRRSRDPLHKTSWCYDWGFRIGANLTLVFLGIVPTIADPEAGDGATGEQAEIAAVALRALETMAQAVRCYGASAGLALLCGRICARMENSPAQAAEFAAQVARARTEGCVAFLNEVARG